LALSVWLIAKGFAGGEHRNSSPSINHFA